MIRAACALAIAAVSVSDGGIWLPLRDGGTAFFDRADDLFIAPSAWANVMPNAKIVIYAPRGPAPKRDAGWGGMAIPWDDRPLVEAMTIDGETGTITITNDCAKVVQTKGKIVLTGCAKIAATLRGEP